MTELRLPFLGTRTYLHGTTLFDALRELAEPGPLAFKFSRLIESDRVLVSDSGEAWASLSHPDRKLCVRPLPRSDEVERRPYDESLVTGRANFGSHLATLSPAWPFSFVATVVPLHKELLKRNVPIARDGQWLFTHLQIERIPDASEPLELRVRAVLPGRMAQSAVQASGIPIGRITFSWYAR